MSELALLLKAINSAENVIVCGHSMPDGDSLGSTLGMGLLLKALGKSVTILSPDPVPKMYGFLAGAGEVRFDAASIEGADTAILVDCTDLNRLGPAFSEEVKKIPVIINIDHHVSNQFFGHYNFVDPQAAATGEQIFQIARLLNQPLNRELATCLYTAVVMDTGSFRYGNTTERTHRICAELLETGIDAAEINTYLFENKELTALLLLGKALCRLEVSKCQRVAWITIPLELTNEMGAGDEHSEGIINYPRMVEGALVGILFREIAEDKVKVGFRSKTAIDVNKIAAVFGGGGHSRASGCQLEMPLQDAVEKVLEEVLSHVDSQNVEGRIDGRNS